MQDQTGRDTWFFGHPKGLAVLAGTELWERFSFYGMQALLMLYMTGQLLTPGHANKVLGLEAYRHILTVVFGPMTDLALAAQTFGLYSGFIYVTPLVGAWLGDRVLGKTRTVTIGAVTMAAGHLTMASEHLFLLALLLLILGAGCVIGNMAAQVGQLYAPDDHRRTRAFGLYLIALNAGALISPLICGTLGEKVGYHWGFAAAGVGMLIGLATYLAGRKHLPPDDRHLSREPQPRLTGAEWRRVVGILLVFLPYILSMAALQQAYGIMLVWADKAVSHTLFGWTVPITWILVFDGLMTITGVLLANAVWRGLAKRGNEPGDITKLGVACLGIAAAWFYIAFVARIPVAPLVLWLGFFVILDFATGWIEAPTASLTSRTAPAPINATMMAMFKLASAFSYFLLGWLGRFYEPLGPVKYWALLGGVSLAGFVLVALFRRPVSRLFSSGTGVDPDPAAGQPDRAPEGA
jgi:POT family proton-dependent oligopeptide transporter